MVKVKVIVFDLFDTLVRDIKFDFQSGLSYLHENILLDGTDKIELENYANTYWKERYDKRSEDNSEVPFEEQLLDFKKKYGFKVNWSLEEIQYLCASAMNVIELFDDTITTLDKLKSFSIPIYLLSNSIFKKNVMIKGLNQYTLEKYFVNTFFSADYKIRKPHKDFFQIVWEDIKKENNIIKKEEVFFVGDNYTADVEGANNFGFTPVFINRKKINGINKRNFIEITDLNELLECISSYPLVEG